MENFDGCSALPRIILQITKILLNAGADVKWCNQLFETVPAATVPKVGIWEVCEPSESALVHADHGINRPRSPMIQ